MFYLFGINRGSIPLRFTRNLYKLQRFILNLYFQYFRYYILILYQLKLRIYKYKNLYKFLYCSRNISFVWLNLTPLFPTQTSAPFLGLFSAREAVAQNQIRLGQKIVLCSRLNLLDVGTYLVSMSCIRLLSVFMLNLANLI